MRGIRVGFLVRQLCDGGAERVVSNLASQFAMNGNHTIIITRTHTDDDYVVDSRVKRYELDEYVGTHINFKTRLKRFFCIRNICKEENLDVLIAFMNDSIPYAIFATKFTKTKSIISVRNAPSVFFVKTKKKLLVKLLYPFADGAVFQTPDAMEWFPKRLQKKSTVLMNPIKNTFYDLSYTPVKNTVINCGRLNYQKNQELLINAFALVAKQNKNAQLRIYGYGELQEQLSRQIDNLGLNDSVFLMGRTDNVAEKLSKASVFVLSSDFEGAPNALMEAMAVGVPAIATDCPCGGPRMLLGNNENGILVPVGDKDALANAIIYLLSNDSVRDNYRKRCKVKSRSFREEDVFTEWGHFISNLIEH